MSPKHYLKRYKKIKNELLGQPVSKKHKQKFVHPCLTFGIYCVSYTFCLSFERIFSCFTQFSSSQSHCLNCHEFHDTASSSPHFTLTFHNLGPRNLKECFPRGVVFSTSKSLQLVCASQYKVK